MAFLIKSFLYSLLCFSFPNKLVTISIAACTTAPQEKKPSLCLPTNLSPSRYKRLFFICGMFLPPKYNLPFFTIFYFFNLPFLFVLSYFNLFMLKSKLLCPFAVQ